MMLLTEEEALEISRCIDKRLSKYPHTFEVAQEVGAKEFDWILSFKLELENGGEDNYEFCFGNKKSMVYPLKKSLGLAIDITEIVNDYLNENKIDKL